jgi:hypothetical protein
MEKPERIIKQTNIDVGFPSGTLEQCVEHLKGAHNEAVAMIGNMSDDLELVSIEFGMKCYGYEDFEYELTITREEPLADFNKRLIEWKKWSENKKKRDDEDRARWAEIARQKEIEELKRKLAELESSK